MTPKEYAQKQLELHEKSLSLFKQAELKHVRLMEIEEDTESKEAESGEEIPYPDEHFDLTMDLALLMREQVDISLQSDWLKLEFQGKVKKAHH